MPWRPPLERYKAHGFTIIAVSIDAAAGADRVRRTGGGVARTLGEGAGCAPFRDGLGNGLGIALTGNVYPLGQEGTMGEVLRIGELAERARVTTRAIRFYERAGVLPPARRGPNAYRLYTPDTVEVLAFVKQAARLGLTLAEIKEIIAIRRGGRPPCAHVHRFLAEKLRELDRKLEDLQGLRRTLRRILVAWKRAPAGPAAVCPHIEGRAIAGLPGRT